VLLPEYFRLLLRTEPALKPPNPSGPPKRGREDFLVPPFFHPIHEPEKTSIWNFEVLKCYDINFQEKIAGRKTEGRKRKRGKTIHNDHLQQKEDFIWIGECKIVWAD
jgi:hypothetical protein